MRWPRVMTLRKKYLTWIALLLWCLVMIIYLSPEKAKHMIQPVISNNTESDKVQINLDNDDAILEMRLRSEIKQNIDVKATTERSKDNIETSSNVKKTQIQELEDTASSDDKARASILVWNEDRYTSEYVTKNKSMDKDTDKNAEVTRFKETETATNAMNSTLHGHTYIKQLKDTEVESSDDKARVSILARNYRRYKPEYAANGKSIVKDNDKNAAGNIKHEERTETSGTNSTKYVRPSAGQSASGQRDRPLAEIPPSNARDIGETRDQRRKRVVSTIMERERRKTMTAEFDARVLNASKAAYAWVESAPEVPVSRAHKVWLLSYQRSGSSFTGDIFQADTNGTYYIYEPLDAVYHAMYGVPHGWTVPADIFTHPNGSERQIPSDEIDAVTMTVDAVYSCNLSSLPITILAHPFWHSFGRGAGRIFRNCLGPEFHSGLKRYSTVFHICGPRFRMSEVSPTSTKLSSMSLRSARNRLNTTLCKSIFYNNGKWGVNLTVLPSQYYVQSLYLVKYWKFVLENTVKLRTCAAATFDKICRASHTRVVKTVRASAAHALPLLHKYPDLKLVHLLRDPRAVGLSRHHAIWSQGLSGSHGPAHLADDYCKVVKRDMAALAFHAQAHPYQPAYRLTYDELVERPAETVIKLMRFAGAHVTVGQLAWVKTQIRSPQCDKWQTEISTRDMSAIRLSCADIWEFKPGRRCKQNVSVATGPRSRSHQQEPKHAIFNLVTDDGLLPGVREAPMNTVIETTEGPPPHQSRKNT